MKCNFSTLIIKKNFFWILCIMCDVKQGVQVIEAFRFWDLIHCWDNRALMCFTNRTVQTAAYGFHDDWRNACSKGIFTDYHCLGGKNFRCQDFDHVFWQLKTEVLVTLGLNIRFRLSIALWILQLLCCILFYLSIRITIINGGQTEDI